MAKLAIIGAQGMLGQDLAKEFPEAILLDKDQIDITDINSVQKVLNEIKPDIVINAAAYTAVDDCETNQELANKVNGEGPGNLAKACKQLDAILVHYSTDYIFNGEKEKGYDESYNQIDPINKYGESKALGEKFIQENSEQYYILRIAWLYGKQGKNFVATMLKLAQEKDELKIINDQHGSPTYTKDVAQQTRKILNEIKPDFGIYHVTNSGACTWHEFAQEIFKLKNIKIRVAACGSEEFPTPAKRPHWSILLNTKLPEMRHWKEALLDYIKTK